MHYWPYYDLIDGKLYDDRMVDRRGKRVAVSGTPDGKPVPYFGSVADAEAWLEANDLRGNVREG